MSGIKLKKLITKAEWIGDPKKPKKLKLRLGKGTFKSEKGGAIDLLIYPTTCPCCGKKLELDFGGGYSVNYAITKDGRMGRMLSDETETYWESPTLNCSGGYNGECEFTFELDGIGQEDAGKVVVNTDLSLTEDEDDE